MDDGDDRQTLWVPVKKSAFGTVSVKLARTPDGRRAGVGFTSAAGLSRVFGASQPSIRISLPALKAMLAPLGVTGVEVDVFGALDPAVLSLGSREHLTAVPV